MLVDEIWDFKSINMGRELEIAGEFVYDSVKKTMAITGLHNQYELNSILYTGAVGIERLQKVYLCLVQPDPTDKESMPKCLLKHNHQELETVIEKYTKDKVSKNSSSLLAVFSEYYKCFRYANYIPGSHSVELRRLFIRFLKKQNGKFNLDEPCAAVQFENFKRFYINELGRLAVHYYEMIENKAREIDTYTYEIDSFSNATRIFWSCKKRSLYDQMVLEQEAVKEMILYIYKNTPESGVFRLLNEMNSLDLDEALINEYLSDLCNGKVTDTLLDYVENFHDEIENKHERKERKEMLSLIGNTEAWFDFDQEDDEDF